MIHDAGTFGNNLKPGGGSEGLRSTKDDQASAGNFVRGFSSFPTNKLIPRGATVGAEGPLRRKGTSSFVLRRRKTNLGSTRTHTRRLWNFGGSGAERDERLREHDEADSELREKRSIAWMSDSGWNRA